MTCPGLQSRKRTIIITKLLCPWGTNMKSAILLGYNCLLFSFHSFTWLWNSKFIFGLCRFPCKEERIVNMWWGKTKEKASQTVSVWQIKACRCLRRFFNERGEWWEAKWFPKQKYKLDRSACTSLLHCSLKTLKEEECGGGGTCKSSEWQYPGTGRYSVHASRN